MNKLLYGVAISAILLGSSAVWASDPAEPKDDVAINNGPVDARADEGGIDLDVTGKEQKVAAHVKFFNVLDITQSGKNNKAGVIQLDDGHVGLGYSYKSGYYYYSSYNGSWTYQTGDNNVDWGAQIARHGGVNFRLTKQDGNGNEAITFQDAGAYETKYGKRRDINLVSIDQDGNHNSASALQKGGVNILGITQTNNNHVARSIQVGSKNFATIDQSGHGNGAYTVQASIADNRNITVTGPSINIKGSSSAVNEHKTINANKPKN